jgi:SAM-dependent methyltransferase
MTIIQFNCKYCGCLKTSDRFFAVESTYGLRDRFSYDICSNCNSIIIADPPKNMSQYYPESYAPHRIKMDRRDLKFILKNFLYLRLNIPIIFNYFLSSESILGVLRILKVPKFARVLDFGCGSGRLVILLRQLGFVNTIGVDPYLSSSQIIDLGICLKQGVNELKGNYDIIILNHSLEHLVSPLHDLKILVEHLSYDGYVIIRCPLANSFAFREYRECWVQLDPPRHIAIPSFEGMEIFAKKLDLVPTMSYCDGTEFQILGSEDLKKGVTIMDSESFYSGRFVSRLKLFLNKIFYTRLIYNLNRRNQSDQAVFVFKRSRNA